MSPIAIFFYILFSLFYYSDIVKLKNKFVLKLPYYIFIIEIWASVSGHFGINVGINGITSFFWFSYILYYIFNYNNKLSQIGISLLVEIGLFLIYIFFRTSFSVDLESMTARYLSYFILFMVIPITYAEVHQFNDFNYFLSIIKKILLLYLVSTIFFSAFKFGENMYGTNIIYGLAHMQPNSIAFLVSIIFFITINLKNKNTFEKNKKLILYLGIIIILCLTLRRTYLLIIITILGGLTLPSITKPKYLFSILFISSCLFMLYSEVGNKRDKFFTMDTEQEGRFIEYILVKEIMSKDLNMKLFGDGELFVTRGKYNLDGKDSRPLHTGHTEILLGAGLVGLLMFILLIISIFIKMIKDSWPYRKKSKLYPIILVYPIIYTILSFSGGTRSPSSMIIMITFIVFSKYVIIYEKRANYYYNTRL